jgi:hypothetical protein
MADETIADYDVRSPASRTLLTVLGTLVAVAIIVGLVLGASILRRDTRVSTSVVDVGDSVQLVIDAGSADVRLVEGDEDVVEIRARITGGLRKTQFELGRRGDEIKIVSGCQTWLSPGCGVAATLEIPKGLPVVVRSTSGDVAADAIAEGVLTVQTSSGNVSASALAVDEFSAETDSGDIGVTFARQPIGVKATTSSGDVRAVVPAGKRTYAVSAKSTSGTVSSQLTPDEQGEGFVLVRSRSGDVRLLSE